MKKSKKILVLGYFGYENNQLDGQTVKTRNVYRLLKENFNGIVKYADTQQFRHGIKPISQFFRDLFSCDYLVILPCLNNLKNIFPVVYVFSRIFNFEIIHIGIGGWHDKYLGKWPLVRKMLGKIKINLLETEITANHLRSLFKYNNVSVFPNFRFEESCQISQTNKSEKLHLVFMARVNKKKGLDTLAELCRLIKSNLYGDRITLTIYGPIISQEDGDYLNAQIINRYDFVEYKGALEPDKINVTLCNYDVFIFPTHYFTEGFPGSILDAYNAGLPVLATNWEHANQFVKHGISGYIVNFEEPVKELYGYIINLYNNPRLLDTMKNSAFVESKKYTPSSAWNLLKQYIDNA